MRFSTSFLSFLSVSLSLLASVSAWPSFDSFDLEARDASLSGHDFYERSAFSMEGLLESRKPKAKLTISKKLAKGKISQKDHELTVELGEAALVAKGYSAGEVVYGWHDERSEDPVEHFTINPTAGPGIGGKGLIHVHRDGSASQGKGGKYRRSPSFESAFDLSRRDLDMLEFHRRNLIEAREAYAEAYESIMDL